MNEKKVNINNTSTLDMTKKALKVGCNVVIEEYLGHEIHPEKDYIDMLQYIYLSAICVNAATSLYFIDLDKCDAKTAKLANIAFAEEMIQIAKLLKDNYVMGKSLTFDPDKFNSTITVLISFIDDLFKIIQSALKIVAYIADSKECVDALPIHNQYINMVYEFMEYYKVFKKISMKVI